MTFVEEHRDLFSVNFKKYTPVHCISVDCKMGAGIAVPIKKKFKLNGLQDIEMSDAFKVGIAVYYHKVYNLMTKPKYHNKPTYESLRSSLVSMKNHATKNDITNIVMPKIGCGLDKLSWPRVREIIKDIFKNTDINILVCYK